MPKYCSKLLKFTETQESLLKVSQILWNYQWEKLWRVWGLFNPFFFFFSFLSDAKTRTVSGRRTNVKLKLLITTKKVLILWQKGCKLLVSVPFQVHWQCYEHYFGFLHPTLWTALSNDEDISKPHFFLSFLILYYLKAKNSHLHKLPKLRSQNLTSQ